MAVSLVSTGITFPDATTQTTAAFPGGTRTFTTSGTVSAAGLPIALNTDGTVSTVSNVAAATSGANVSGYTVDSFNAGNTTLYIAATNTFVVSFITNTTLFVRAGTLSGSTITWGTAVSVSAANYASFTLDEASNSCLAVYRTGGALYAKVITISGTTCTAQAQVTIDSGSVINIQNVFSVYDNISGKHVVACQDVSASEAYSIYTWVATVSGNTSTYVAKGYIFGNNATLTGANANNAFGATTDRAGTIVFWAVGNGTFVNSTNCMIQIGTISGTTLTVGTNSSMTFTSSISAAVISYNPAYAVFTLMIISSTNLYSALITTNATTRTWSAVTGITSGSTAWVNQLSGNNTAVSQGIALSYDFTANKIILVFRRQSDGTVYAVPGQITANVVSGTRSLVFEGSASWTTVVSGTAYTSTNSIAYSSSAGKIVYIVGVGASGWSWAVSTTPYSTNKNFIGVSTASAASGASLSCTIIGGVNTNVTGLVTGSNYYASSTGTITISPSSATLVGRALSATSLLVTQGLATI